MFLNKSEKQNNQLPISFSLEPNYPNPFNPNTNIKYGLPDISDVELSIYDITGNEIKTYFINSQLAGYQHVVWDGKNSNNQQVASGTYIYRLKARSLKGEIFIKSAKMLLIK